MQQHSLIYINTTHNDSKLKERRNWFLEQPGCQWVLEPNGKAEAELKITKSGVFLIRDKEKLYFHPSMALIRLVTILKGGSDRYLEVTQLTEGNWLLDATLGLGTDALIGACAVGETGKVIAIEQSPILAALVKDGLAHMSELIPNIKNDIKLKAWILLAKAAQRIDVRWGNHLDYLPRFSSRSFDVVYFDPMFRRTQKQSVSIQPLHSWSDHHPLDYKAIAEACRIARNRVVIKERKNSIEFERLGFNISAGGRYSTVDYGVIQV